MHDNAANISIDPKVISGLRELFDEAAEAQTFLNDLILIFDSAGGSTVREINTTLERKDYAGVSMLAHKLKGISSNIGAIKLRLVCSRLEKEATSIPPQELTFLCSEIAREFEVCSQTLHQDYFQND